MHDIDWPVLILITRAWKKGHIVEQMEYGLLAVSALDGRYKSRVDELSMSLSEAGLIKARVKVEAAWLLHLADHPVVGKDIKLSAALGLFLKSFTKV